MTSVSNRFLIRQEHVPVREPDGRPRLLDLFSGAGGAAMGYHRAGFDIVGVDIRPQPNYPFEFWQADALEYLGEALDRFAPFNYVDAIHASPPCQAYTALRVAGNANNRHPRLIEPVRRLLRQTGLPYVIENVPQSPLDHPVRLCGASFGLGVTREECDWHPKTIRLLGARGRDLQRHRLFELSFPMLVSPCWHQRDVIGFYGDHARARRRKDPNSIENTNDFPDVDRVRLAQIALGIDWTDSWDELREAIPPAYTELIGHQLLQHLRVAA
jgi:DNA (cytosine-5)-methyltransferase 1